MNKEPSTKNQEPALGGEYCVIIEPNRSWFRLPWRDLLHYRDLWFLLVRRDFVAKYKQTILAPSGSSSIRCS